MNTKKNHINDSFIKFLVIILIPYIGPIRKKTEQKVT